MTVGTTVLMWTISLQLFYILFNIYQNKYVLWLCAPVLTYNPPPTVSLLFRKLERYTTIYGITWQLSLLIDDCGNRGAIKDHKLRGITLIQHSCNELSAIGNTLHYITLPITSCSLYNMTEEEFYYESTPKLWSCCHYHLWWLQSFLLWINT